MAMARATVVTMAMGSILMLNIRENRENRNDE